MPTPKKQPLSAIVDWSNPITRGLASLLVPIAGYYDPVLNKSATGSTSGLALGQYGIGHKFDGSTTELSIPVASPAAYTVFAIAKTNTDVGSRNIVSFGTGGVYSAQLRQDGAQLSFYHSDVGDKLASESGVMTAGSEHVIAATWDGATMRLYRAGQLKDATAASSIRAVATMTYGPAWNGNITLVAYFTRELTSFEIVNLTKYPWQLLRQPSRRLWVAPAVVGGGITGAAAATQAPNTSSATGAVAATGVCATVQTANTVVSAGAAAVAGSAALSQTANTVAASGTVTAAGTITGAAALAQAANSIAANGSITISSSVGVAQVANTAAASGASTVAGTAASVQAVNSAAAAGSSAISGTAASTQSQNSVSATASVGNGLTGSVATTQALNTASATITVSVIGASATTQAGNVTAAVGSAAITGTNTSTQAPNTTAATAFVGNVISGAVYSLQAANTVTAAAIVTDVAIVVATTLHQDVQFLLLTLAPAGGVSYAANTQQPPVYPYMTWLRIASTPNVSLRGPSTLQNTRVQIDIYSRNVVEAVALETALEAAFAAWAVQNVPLLSFDLIDPETRSYRVTKEYSVWARN